MKVLMYFFSAVCLAVSVGPAAAQEPAPLIPQATVRLMFDENDGAAIDTALTGQAADQGLLQNGTSRVSSPFWNQAGKRALNLDAARQQYVELADSADLDRPDALSFSLLVVNLLEDNDGGYHGLVAKRGQQDGKTYTNYGINFTMQQDNYQVYINDGRGYRVVNYSTKAALPRRKLLHVTATFQVADAPGQDADTDADDVRIEYYVNGKPVAPKSVTNGFVDGNSGWITDVEIAGLVNNLPVTLGRSEAAGEYFSGVIDEFLLFPKALSAEEAQRLFLEVAGKNVEQLIQADQAAPSNTPNVVRLSQPGVTAGETTQVVVVGTNLLPAPQLVIPAEGVTAEIVGEPKADRVVAKLTVSPETRLGFYPLYVKTANGISNPEPISIDRLPHRNLQEATSAQPAGLPVALFGNLAGGQELRAYFQGQQGQRLVADLELKRLGGKANPVLELKTSQHTPLAIAWGAERLGGDVRLEATLPQDGLYYVELHDLVYRAPGPNAFRLKLGDLKLVDSTFPAAAVAGNLELSPIGTGFQEGAVVVANVQNTEASAWAPITFPASEQITGPWPHLRRSSAVENVETAVPAGQFQTIDATLVDPAITAVAIEGRLRAQEDHDQYLLQVTPGQNLRFILESQTLHSPLQGEIELLRHPEGQRLAISSDQPSEADPQLDFTVPAGVTQLRVSVRDLFRQGSPFAIYRLVIRPKDRPDFSLTITESALQVPQQGTGLLELTVNRAGYQGAIGLSIVGGAQFKISPAVIPANVSGKVLCRLEQSGEVLPAAMTPLLKLIGTAVDVNPPIVNTATRVRSEVLPAYSDTMAVGVTVSRGLSVQLDSPPAVVFKGLPQTLKLRIQKAGDQDVAQLPVRITSRSTETVRQRQPNNPGAGTFPVVEISPGTMLDVGSTEADVQLLVPLDVAEPALEFVIVADAMPHAYSDRVVATAYSQPVRVSVQTAVAPQVEPASLAVVAETPHEIVGKLQRTAGFTAPVTVSILGLPAGYQAPEVTVPGDQNEFKLTVTAPKVTAETPLANVKLRIASSGSQLVADQDLAVKVLPKP